MAGRALAIAFLTVLGASGEALGYDRMLKTNTAKTRQHSLFRQGCMLYELIPNMPKERLLPLIKRFAAELENLALFGMSFPRARNEGSLKAPDPNFICSEIGIDSEPIGAGCRPLRPCRSVPPRSANDIGGTPTGAPGLLPAPAPIFAKTPGVSPCRT